MEIHLAISLNTAELEQEQAERRASIEKVQKWLQMQEAEKVLELVEKLGPREVIVRANAQIRLMLEACEAGKMDEARRIRDEMMAELAEWVRIHGQE
jgi:erythromycin esterase-like protein